MNVNAALLLHYPLMTLASSHTEVRPADQLKPPCSYLINNPDLMAAGFSRDMAWEHYLKHGMFEKRNARCVDLGCRIPNCCMWLL